MGTLDLNAFTSGTGDSAVASPNGDFSKDLAGDALAYIQSHYSGNTPTQDKAWFRLNLNHGIDGTDPGEFDRYRVSQAEDSHGHLSAMYFRALEGGGEVVDAKTVILDWTVENQEELVFFGDHNQLSFPDLIRKMDQDAEEGGSR